MGINTLFCAAQIGIVAKEVEVEVSFTRALPSFSITGLAGNAIQESRQRVQSSLLANGFKFPPLKITVNLSPSDLPKQGSFYDLPIALLIALHNTLNLTTQEKKIFAFGELGLDGRIKDTPAIYPLLFSLLSNANCDSIFILPKSAQEFYSKIPNLKAYYAESLKEALDILQNPPPLQIYDSTLPFAYLEIPTHNEKFYYTQDFPLDFHAIIGQERAKRAALIAACGFHNILFEGSAGSGKSMIASRIPYILPPLTLNAMLQLAATTLEISPNRPFRNPHNSATKAAILGSAVGQNIKPGEIGLANMGVLFFDELPHFPKSILESLREPLQNHNFTISRLQTKITYPTDFMFVGAMNPCPCGNLLSLTKECRCNQKEIKDYKSKISDPFWDRLDIFVAMQENTHLESSKNAHRVDSKTLQTQVLNAFKFQRERGQGCFNARLEGAEFENFCALLQEEQEILEKAIQKFGISKRGSDKILRLSRSIADLEGSKRIKKSHLLEALSFRRI
ncbi:YifB family Mg chelatase-like AAA ATPase [Helicobacter turcicus]|uniref:YifB family Mg chelatase-like AAA ATPase n=1 Tax=Helicobacter turcicus TaxID=2867412 RepID=A0ABS7JNZ0_9HELI|nr:YifB family Mg chelatase-like AAA ATPase [Helicobacter turcicus]MBX7491087.1 YifB family Mg chelatase-like AAA ATPase [Helicobacter turcicus]MBX7545952.1 YifB family Mg chelatase-like AAA ATPase [Helicobacter turcicus]